MRLHMRTVDQHFGRRTALGRQRFEHGTPDALLGPALVPVVQRLAGAIDRRRVLPAAARLQHMHDAADHPPIIDPRHTARLVRQQRPQPLPLLIAQPKLTRQRSLPINREAESHSRRHRNPVYGSRP